jgi:hypothetical protein
LPEARADSIAVRESFPCFRTLFVIRLLRPSFFIELPVVGYHSKFPLRQQFLAARSMEEL